MIEAMIHGRATHSKEPAALPLVVDARSPQACGCDAPRVPAWAISCVPTIISLERGACDGAPDAREIDVCVQSGTGASLVSVTLDGVDRWSQPSLDAAVAHMVRLSLEVLRSSHHPQPVRLWNFLPGICEPLGDGLDRYRVFNIARHRVFASIFGKDAVLGGQLPTASCVGHAGRSLAIHALGAAGASLPIENPRQIPAFAYSTKFGPKPPCFSRAGIAQVGGRRLLLLAGTASVLGEESVHPGSLELQCRETMVNLEAVIAAGRRADNGARGAAREQAWSDGLLATRIYYRHERDLPRVAEFLPPEMTQGPEVELIRADICREELLVEIEVVVDLDHTPPARSHAGPARG